MRQTIAAVLAAALLATLPGRPSIISSGPTGSAVELQTVEHAAPWLDGITFTVDRTHGAIIDVRYHAPTAQIVVTVLEPVASRDRVVRRVEAYPVGVPLTDVRMLPGPRWVMPLNGPKIGAIVAFEVEPL